MTNSLLNGITLYIPKLQTFSSLYVLNENLLPIQYNMSGTEKVKADLVKKMTKSSQQHPPAPLPTSHAIRIILN